MKISRIVFGIIVVAVSQLALAGEPAPDAKALATIEALVDHCAKANPASASNYQKRVQLVAQGASEETLAKVRKTDEYRQAHDSAVESLAKTNEQDTKKMCSQALTENE